MGLLEKLSQRDGEWRKMAIYLTKDKEIADDLVQEFYLRMHKKDGKIKLEEKYDDYIFIILKNLNYDLNIRNKKYDIKLDDEYIPDFVYNEIEENQEIQLKEYFEDFYKLIEEFLDEGYKESKTKQYKIGLLKLNSLKGMSMQKIADATGITKRSIQLAIESVRKQIKDKFQDEYKNYKTNLNNGSN
jgi:RNA polymerase sigma factor (sigma-70 family)